MSLQAKFAVLVLVILTAVAGSLGAAVWSFRLLEQESVRPAADAASALKRLDAAGDVLDLLKPPRTPDFAHLAKDLAEAAAGLGTDSSLATRIGPEAADKLQESLRRAIERAELAGRSGSAQDARSASSAAAEARGLLEAAQPLVLTDAEAHPASVVDHHGQLDAIANVLNSLSPRPPDYPAIAGKLTVANKDLDADGSLSARVGLGTASNLRQRLTHVADLTQKAGVSKVERDVATATVSAGESRALLARVQGRVLKEVDINAAHADDIRSRLVAVLGFTLGSTILVGVLGLILMRRWVIAPVARLRIATAAVARGDFTHRISAPGSGELADLSHEVDHMAGMVGRMQDERVERERLAATGEMVRRLAHNLRNPLSGIRGLAEVSLTELPPGSELRDNQSRIVAAVDRFERWLADLLNVTSPLRINPQPTPVRAWLAGMLTTQSPMAQARNVALIVDDAGAPDTAMFDPRHLEHALVALVTNAIQATPERGSVRVTLSQDTAASTWRIRVADTGPGIPKSLREKVFTPYFTTKKDGSGIGLPLARQIARSHGGDLTLVEPAREHDSGGATIDIELPIHGPPPPPGGASETGGPAETPRAQNPRARGRRESPPVDLADAGKGRP